VRGVRKRGRMRSGRVGIAGGRVGGRGRSARSSNRSAAVCWVLLVVERASGRRGRRKGGRRGGVVLHIVVGRWRAGEGGGMERGREGGGAVGRHGGGLLELEFNGSDLFKPVLPDGLKKENK